MALTNKLTAIADAIREKTNTTDAMTLDEMATAISGITGGGGDLYDYIPEEAFIFTGDFSYKFSHGTWDWFIEKYGNKITTQNLSSCNYMFRNSKVTEIPFDINITDEGKTDLSNIFINANYLRKPPYINGKPGKVESLFEGCSRLTEIPEDWADKIDFSTVHSSTQTMKTLFKGCYSLRTIPQNVIDNCWNSATAYYSIPYGNMFNDCTVLERVNNFPVHQKPITSSAMTSFITSCSRLKSFTFATQEDGTPYTAEWKSQVFDLMTVGCAVNDNNITNYSDYHGITAETKVNNAEAYATLKDHPDYWSSYTPYSRYNHDSAVETINSLPDTSAYLAANGGTNTIKFKSAAGELTDGGAINTLTEEEIAVAAAKGWTVTLSV